MSLRATSTHLINISKDDDSNPGQPVSVLDNPFQEECFPNIQSKPFWVQFESVSSCPVTFYLEKETNPHFTTASFQVAVGNDKVSPDYPLLPQLVLISLVPQTLQQVHAMSWLHGVAVVW